MGGEKNESPKGWTEYGQLVLAKLDELHNGHKEIKDGLTKVNERLARLEAKQKDLEDLERWQREVYSTWSPVQMKEAKDEIYSQKGKWTGVWFVFITVQVIWGIILVFKDQIFK